MHMWKDSSRSKKAGIIIGVVAAVVVLALTGVLGVHLYRYVRLSEQVEAGIVVTAFSDADRQLVLWSIHLPTQEAAVLTEVDCVQGWRDSFTQAIIEVDKTDHEAFEAALLTQFDRAEDPGRASVGSFFSDRPHYAAITTENRVGSYRRSVHDEAVAEIGAYAWGDKIVYAVYVDTVPVDLQPYVKQQIREDNYVSYK